MQQSSDRGTALAGLPERLSAPLRAYLEQGLPPNVALMRLLVEARSREEVDTALNAALKAFGGPPASDRARVLLELWHANPQAWSTVRTVLADVAHDAPAPSEPAEAVSRIANAFDRAVRASPEGSVALYALGNSGLLEAATAEILQRLRQWGLVGADKTILDLGCGVGRLAGVLAAESRFLVGVDVSTEMLRVARRRCADRATVAFLRSSGRDLAAFADESFDLVLAVDSFPYLVQAGGDLAAEHIAGSARILRPGGALVILNYSYRGAPEADRADVEAGALANGLTLVRAGERPFALWDGVAFQLAKPALT